MCLQQAQWQRAVTQAVGAVFFIPNHYYRIAWTGYLAYKAGPSALEWAMLGLI